MTVRAVKTYPALLPILILQFRVVFNDLLDSPLNGEVHSSPICLQLLLQINAFLTTKVTLDTEVYFLQVAEVHSIGFKASHESIIQLSIFLLILSGLSQLHDCELVGFPENLELLLQRFQLSFGNGGSLHNRYYCNSII